MVKSETTAEDMIGFVGLCGDHRTYISLCIVSQVKRDCIVLTCDQYMNFNVFTTMDINYT
jgi:hypothetical protein